MKEQNRTFWSLALAISLAGSVALALLFRWAILRIPGAEENAASFLWIALCAAGGTWALLWIAGALLLCAMKKQRRQFEQAAFYDSETGFYNRAKFYLDAADALATREKGKRRALLLFHLQTDGEKKPPDDGKKPPDDEGAAFQIGRALMQHKKNDDLFGRQYGDRFEMLFHYSAETEIAELVDAVRDSAGVRVSCGAAPLPDDAAEVRRWEDKALSALNSADKAGRAYGVYREKPRDQLRKEITGSMAQALENNEFVIFLQPKYDLEKKTVCGAEALVRWIHEDGTTVLPRDFIGVFEANGFIIKVDLCVLRQACERLRAWLDAGFDPVPISINISEKYILNQDFVASIVSIVRQYRIPHHLLELDISGTSVSLNVDTLQDIRHKYYGREFSISLDEIDGYGSSFRVLDDLPVDTIKLGEAFFANARGDSKVFEAIRSILAVLKKREIAVVAEGIETKEQMDLLKELHCRVAQGYYFSKPLPVKVFETLLVKPTKKEPAL